eukprot:12349023-Alexandrium_andersonii.AAC.1
MAVVTSCWSSSPAVACRPATPPMARPPGAGQGALTSAARSAVAAPVDEHRWVGVLAGGSGLAAG